MEAVVVAFNSETPLSGLLNSPTTQNAFSRIIVVDNASTDRTVEVARAGGAEVVALEHNIGFGAAANVGIAATAQDFIALLNPDIEVLHDDSIPRLCEHFDDSRVGVVAPGLVLPDKTIQDSARDIPTPMNLVRRRLIERRAGMISADGVADVAWVVGAVMVLRRSAFDSVAGFDRRYHVYFEDVDLCVRLRRAGWLVRLDPTVVLAHQHAAESQKSLLGWTTRQHVRSAALFYLRFPRFLLSSRDSVR